MTAFGGKADIEIDQYRFASALWATAWNTPGDNIGGRACNVYSSFMMLNPQNRSVTGKNCQKRRMANERRMAQPFGSNGYSRIRVFVLFSK